MSQQQRRRTTTQAPLLYTSLSTRRSSFPSWLLIISSPTPHVIKRSDLGNEVSELLINSNRALQVPPLVNDIAESMQWLLTQAPVPLSYCYRAVAVNLLFVCDFTGEYHIYPYDAHLKIAMVCMNKLVYSFLHREVVVVANEAVTNYLTNRWGDRIHLVGFQRILLDAYNYLLQYF